MIVLDAYIIGFIKIYLQFLFLISLRKFCDNRGCYVGSEIHVSYHFLSYHTIPDKEKPLRELMKRYRLEASKLTPLKKKNTQKFTESYLLECFLTLRTSHRKHKKQN